VGAPFEVATKASFRISHPKSDDDDDDDDDDAIQYLTPQLAAASTLRPRRRYIIYIQDGSRRHHRLYTRAARLALLSYNAAAAATDVPRTSPRPVYVYIICIPSTIRGTRRRPPLWRFPLRRDIVFLPRAVLP